MSDAVFGFAVTLLVVSLEIPRDFSDLVTSLKGIPVFAVSFALLLLVWHTHWRFFDHFPVADGWIVFLNSALLFAVLCFVYPMKYMWVLLLGGEGGPQGMAGLSFEQASALLAIYSGGFGLVFALFTAMYLRAYGLRHRLRLDLRQAHQARAGAEVQMVYVLMALVSLALVGMRTAWALPAAGYCYSLLGPAHYWLGVRHDRERKQLGSRPSRLDSRPSRNG